jgi:hypothetical protein
MEKNEEGRSRRSSKEEAKKDGFGNTVFGSRWCDVGSLSVAKPQCNAIE